VDVDDTEKLFAYVGAAVAGAFLSLCVMTISYFIVKSMIDGGVGYIAGMMAVVSSAIAGVSAIERHCISCEKGDSRWTTNGPTTSGHTSDEDAKE